MRARLAGAVRKRKITAAIAATMRSRRASSQRTPQNAAVATARAHATVVPRPIEIDPPNASARLPAGRPATAVSISSIAGTTADASTATPSAKTAPERQPGRAAGSARSLRAAASQQAWKARTKSAVVMTAATAITSMRESWTPTSS
jgi:hypothetical protein